MIVVADAWAKTLQHHADWFENQESLKADNSKRLNREDSQLGDIPLEGSFRQISFDWFHLTVSQYIPTYMIHSSPTKCIIMVRINRHENSFRPIDMFIFTKFKENKIVKKKFYESKENANSMMNSGNHSLRVSNETRESREKCGQIFD